MRLRSGPLPSAGCVTGAHAGAAPVERRAPPCLRPGTPSGAALRPHLPALRRCSYTVAELENIKKHRRELEGFDDQIAEMEKEGPSAEWGLKLVRGRAALLPCRGQCVPTTLRQRLLPRQRWHHARPPALAPPADARHPADHGEAHFG